MHRHQPPTHTPSVLAQSRLPLPTPSSSQVFCEALDVSIGKQAWVAILITPVVVFCWLRNLKDLAPFSLVANLCICFSLLVIFYEEIYSFL